MNSAGIRLGGPSCAEVNFGMHAITRTKQTKLLSLTIRPCGALSFTKGASALLNLGITNSDDAFIVGDNFPVSRMHADLLTSQHKVGLSKALSLHHWTCAGHVHQSYWSITFLDTF